MNATNCLAVTVLLGLPLVYHSRSPTMCSITPDELGLPTSITNWAFLFPSNLALERGLPLQILFTKENGQNMSVPLNI